MNAQEALRLIDARAAEGETWHLHSRQVGRVARALGQGLRDAGHPLDLETLTVQALLHDVGRSFNHGPLHGWTGYVFLRSQDLATEGRGCLVHWLKGRGPDELARHTRLDPKFVARVYGELEPAAWSLEDSVLSLADSCVRHSTIVPHAERHRDLLVRYGDSPSMRRSWELADEQAAQIGRALRAPVDELLRPLYGDELLRVA